jgi:CRISPR-associated protein Cas4
VIVIILLLVLGAVVYVALGWLQARRRGTIGLEGASVVAADDSQIGVPTLRSEHFGLVGRPDHLVRIEGRMIPVEQKPHARRVHDSHVMQLAAECLLVSEFYAQRPSYGLLVLANGEQHRVPFTRDLETRLIETLDRMHGLLETDAEPGKRWLGKRCHACGFFSTCWRDASV